MSTQTVDPPSSATTPIRKPGETQRLQTVCIEIPIIVQGSRNSHPPQPFLEETRTVIVFPHGAVLRLTEVVTQGQIVIIQNMRLKQEVACRVTSSKPSASVKGYVEVEFTQPTPGFWGIGFPGEAITQRNEVTAPVAPVSAQPAVAAPTTVAPPSARPVNGQPTNGQPAIIQATKESRVEVAPTPVAPAKIETPAPQVKRPTPEDTLALNRAIVAAFASQPPKPASAAPKVTEIVESVQARVEKIAEVSAAPVAQVPAPVVQEVTPTPVPVVEVAATPVQVEPVAPIAASPVAATPVTAAPAAVAPPVAMPPAATQRDSGKLSEAIRENVRENLSNKARDEARQDLRSARQFEVPKPASPAAPISLAESLDPSNAAAPSIKIPNAPTTGSKPFSKKAKKEKDAANKQAAAFAEHSGVQVAEAKLFGQKTESTLSSAAPSNKMKVVAIAAVVVVVLAGGAFGYRWYARAQSKSSLVAAAPTPSAPGAVNPGVTPPVNSSVTGQPTSNPAAPGTTKNSPVVQQQKAPGSVTNTNPAGTKPVSNAVNGPQQHRQSSLPMNIAAPKAPSAGAPDAGSSPSPELNLQTPPSNIGNGQTISLGSISSLPGPPPASRGSASAPVNTSASNFVAPKLLSTANPVYPKQALVRGDQGDVMVTAMVNEQGKVYGAKAMSGPPTLREAAVDAVSMYRYEPGKLNGRNITSIINVTIKFKR